MGGTEAVSLRERWDWAGELEEEVPQGSSCSPLCFSLWLNYGSLCLGLLPCQAPLCPFKCILPFCCAVIDLSHNADDFSSAAGMPCERKQLGVASYSPAGRLKKCRCHISLHYLWLAVMWTQSSERGRVELCGNKATTWSWPGPAATVKRVILY